MLITVYLNIPLIEVNLNLLSGCTATSIRMQMPRKNDSRPWKCIMIPFYYQCNN